MANFRVKLNGKNFLLDLNGEPTKFGFYATSYIKAASPAEAGKIATILIHQNRILKESVLYEGVDRPSMEILEITPMNPLKFLLKKSKTELKFYSEDDPALEEQ